MDKNLIKGRLCISSGIIVVLISASFMLFSKVEAEFLQATFFSDYALFFQYFSAFIIFCGYLIILLGKQYLAKEQSIEKVLLNSKKKPVLYLRSFISDKEVELASSNGIIRIEQTLEDKIKMATKILGPLIAIGDPNEDMPTLGAARSYYDNEEWKIRFQQYSLEAQLIILSIGLTESIIWELSELLKMKLESKLLLHLKLNQSEWELFLLKFKSEYPDADYYFPSKITNPALMYFNQNIATYFKPSSRFQYALNMYLKNGDYYIIRSYLEEFKGVKKRSQNFFKFIITIIIILAITFSLMIVAHPDIIDLLND
ncbi:hypothetical protein [Flavobacterium sp. ZS1P14]|uniref:hypothetical protein n=1 Tax=Flavobacterium sp. ZS1P14 TaxID=3401729 RepID=UPI003AAEF789